jgi:hypothetical protein
VPQVRVLQLLMPDDPTRHPINWPAVNRAQLAIRAGYTGTSGSITRALNGIREGSSSGKAHPGLLALGLVEELLLDVNGVDEMSYLITPAGIRAYQAHLAAHGGRLPSVKDAALCTNDRYLAQADALGGEQGGGPCR